MYEKLWDHQKIAYGGDYNPEQWDEATWAEDMRLFKLAGIDTLTLNVFSWAALQPSEDTYDFSKLDNIMALVHANGMKVVLGTSTAAHPAWMARKYPEVLRTEITGMKRKYGIRHNSCPNSSVYQKYSVALAEKLAERYGHYDNIIAWHISNEYGGECYCENCEKAFRKWLQARYGSLEAVNQAWNTAFWSHTFYDWDEIVAPTYLTEHYAPDDTCFQGISLDYRRFNSDSILHCYCLESDAIQRHTPHIPVTTNFMEFYKGLDYQKWAKHMDFVSWDSYPTKEYTPAKIALNHELIRGTKLDKPFVLMESTPSSVNWRPINPLKRPGVMRLQSYQAVAHGSDSVMFFQMRRSVGSCEKYHGAIIDHVGHEHTRVFREAAALGAELHQIGDRLLGSLIPAEVGILFDWENWWAIDYSTGPSVLRSYHDEVLSYYNALHSRNILADIVPVDGDLTRYKVLVAPMLYMVKPGVDERLREFVRNGGSLIVGYFSGYVNESDIVTLGGYPGKLRDILGIWVEEIDALREDEANHFTWDGERYPATVLCDLLHSEGAEVLSTYEEDFYAGMPVLTCNNFGKGKAYYVATRSNDAFYGKLMEQICRDQNVRPVMQTPAGVEATCRKGQKGTFIFLLNHNPQAVTLIAEGNYRDILSRQLIAKGEEFCLQGVDVRILECLDDAL